MNLESKILKDIVKISGWFEKHFDGDLDRLDRCLKAYGQIKGEVGLKSFIEIVSVDKYGTTKDIENLKVELGLQKELNPNQRR